MAGEAEAPGVRVVLAGERFHPGDTLAGAFVIPGGVPADAESVELSVLWRTTGKGIEDLGVAHYEAWTAAAGTLAALPNPGTFAVPLPAAPWSYAGTLVSIVWAVRVRVRYGETGEVVAEAPFILAPRGR